MSLEGGGRPAIIWSEPLWNGREWYRVGSSTGATLAEQPATPLPETGSIPLPAPAGRSGETPRADAIARAENVIAAAERVSHLPSELCDFIREQASELAEARKHITTMGQVQDILDAAPVVHSATPHRGSGKRLRSAEDADDFTTPAIQSTSGALNVPEGCTVADAKMLRQANHKLAAENHALRRCLRWYANGEHYTGLLHWEGPSGEDENWLCPPIADDLMPEDRAAFIAKLDAAMVEDGGVARATLVSGTFSVESPEDEPKLIRGEPEWMVEQAAATASATGKLP